MLDCRYVEVVVKGPPSNSSVGLEFEKGNEQSKQVYIRDQLDSILAPVFFKMRLHPHEAGIHPFNRDEDAMTPSGVWTRGARVIASGFSFAAMGKLWAFEDHPIKKHISRHTVEVTKGASSASLTAWQ